MQSNGLMIPKDGVIE